MFEWRRFEIYVTQTHSRYIQVGDWCFELKAVRALKVDQYGKPYQAIANCNINGDKMYVDGLLNKDDDEFTKKDFVDFCQFAKKIGIDSVVYHRFQGDSSVYREVKINDKNAPTIENETNTEASQPEVHPQEVPLMRVVE